MPRQKSMDMVISPPMKDYFKLISFLKGHLKLFSVAVVVMLVSSFFEVFQFSMLIPLTDRIFTNKKIVIPNQLPQPLTAIIDKLNSIEPQALFPMLLIGFSIVMVIKNVLVILYQYLMSDVSQRIMRDIRFRLYEKIQSLSLDYFSKKRTGELISRITHDASVIENAASYGVIDLFRQSFMIVLLISAAFLVDIRSALIVFLVFPLIGLPMSQIGKRLRKISRNIQEKMADINSHLLETISGIKIVKAFCTENYENQRFKSQNQDFYKLKMKSVKRLVVISPLTEIIGGLLGMVVLAWFGYRVMNGQISFGAFVMFFGSIMQIISPVKKLGNVYALTQQALAANERIFEVLDMQPTVKENPQARDLKEMRDSIVLENVSFQYDQESGIVLKDINLEIRKGELVAVVGPTGTGKTTLVNLIPRFYDATKGSVKIDGNDVKDLTFKSLREQFGIVTQETILFNDTVRANIAYGRREASQDEIESSAQKAFAHLFISKMPNGYDTIIGDRGFRLSGGEKQRISIARAILRNPPILILDEATSQLDSESEKFVQEALDALMKGRTVIAIAHRLSTVIRANKIVVLEHGQIVGMGRHDELLTTCPLYEKLHRMQFQL